MKSRLVFGRETPKKAGDFTPKDDLIKSGLSARTVQYAYLASLRNLMGFAVTNRHVSSNPLLGLGVKVKAAKRNRPERGFTDSEAKIVLQATMEPFDGRLPPDQKRARRWLPWICNYSGARIGEAAQLRKEDFVLEEGVWIMLIRPEAGSVKTRDARRVPVHPHLIEQGLIDVIKKLPKGFIRIQLDAAARQATTQCTRRPAKTLDVGYEALVYRTASCSQTMGGVTDSKPWPAALGWILARATTCRATPNKPKDVTINQRRFC